MSKKTETITYQKYSAIVENYLSPLMAEWGFCRRKEPLFVRENGDVVCELDALPTVDLRRDEGVVHVSVSVGYRSLAQFLCEFPDFADPPRKAVGIGGLVTNLLPKYPELSWRLDAQTEVEHTGNEIVQCVISRGQPFFSLFAELPNAMEVWASRSHPFFLLEHLYLLAGSCWLAGQYERAIDVVQSIQADAAAEYEKHPWPRNRHEVGKAERFLAFLASKPRAR